MLNQIIIKFKNMNWELNFYIGLTLILLLSLYLLTEFKLNSILDYMTTLAFGLAICGVIGKAIYIYIRHQVSKENDTDNK